MNRSCMLWYGEYCLNGNGSTNVWVWVYECMSVWVWVLNKLLDMFGDTLCICKAPEHKTVIYLITHREHTGRQCQRDKLKLPTVRCPGQTSGHLDYPPPSLSLSLFPPNHNRANVAEWASARTPFINMSVREDMARKEYIEYIEQIYQKFCHGRNNLLKKCQGMSVHVLEKWWA